MFQTKAYIFFCSLVFGCCATAQVAQNSPKMFSVDQRLFGDCSQVEVRAVILASEQQGHSHVIGLYPAGGKMFYDPFPSDHHAKGPAAWISENLTYGPFALIYSVGSSYLFRCRNDKGQNWESAGPNGDPLRFEKGITFLHFETTPIDVAHVFLLSRKPLSELDGRELMADAARRLGARQIYLYIRNDPWFLVETGNSLPFAFTEAYPRISVEQYQASETLYCSTGRGCRIYSLVGR